MDYGFKKKESIMGLMSSLVVMGLTNIEDFVMVDLEIQHRFVEPRTLTERIIRSW